MEKIFDWFLPIKVTDGRVLRGVVQYETASVVRIHLCDDGNTVNLSACDNIVFTLERSDGTHFVQRLCDELSVYDVENGIIDLILCGEKTAVCGICTAVLDLYCGEKHITSARLRYYVEPCIVVPEDEAAEDSRFPILMELIGTVEALDEDMRYAEEKRIMTNIRNGEGENSLVGCDGGADSEEASRSLGKGCVSLGESCVSGCMAYYIKSVDRENKKIYLSNVQVTPVFSTDDNTDTDFETPAYDVGDVFNVRSGNHYIAIGKITSVSNNVVMYTDEQGFANDDFNSLEEFDNNPQIDDNTFYVAAKPFVGVVPIVVFTFSSGHSLISSGSYGINVGFGNILGGDFGLNVGSGNFSGYMTTTLGSNHYAPGQCSFAAGIHNTGIGYMDTILGGFNYAGANGIVELGHGLYLTYPHQHARGLYNVSDPQGKFADVFGIGYEQTNADGTKTIVRKNGWSLDWDGNMHFLGKVYADCENGTGTGHELARAALIGFNSPNLTGLSENGTLYSEIRTSLNYEVKTNSDGLIYTHMIPQNDDAYMVLPRYSFSPKIPLSQGTVWFKILMRTNQTVTPYAALQSVKDANGNAVSSAMNYAMYEIPGDGEWHEVLIKFDRNTTGTNCAPILDNAYEAGSLQIHFAGRYKKGSSFYNTDGTLKNDAYFDIASWAIFTDEVSAQSYDLAAKEHTKSLVSYVDEKAAEKADKVLANVENDVFKAKAFEAGISGRGYKTIGTDSECDYVVTDENNALAVFRQAVDEAENGDVLVILPGTYSGSETLNISKSITLAGIGDTTIGFSVGVKYSDTNTYEVSASGCCFENSVKCDYLTFEIGEALKASRFKAKDCVFKGECDTIGEYTDCIFDGCRVGCSESYLYLAEVKFDRCKFVKTSIGAESLCSITNSDIEFPSNISLTNGWISGGTIKYFGTETFLISEGGMSDVTFIGNVPFDCILENCRRIAVEEV